MDERTWTPRRIAGIVVVVIGLLLCVEWFWVTDTEAIEGRLDSMSHAIETADMAGAIGAFSNDFSIVINDRVALSKAHLALAMAEAFEEGVVKRLDVRACDITVGGDTAVTDVVFNATAKRGEEGGFPGTVRVKFAWGREADGWRITSIADTSAKAFFFEWFGNNKHPLWGQLQRYVKRGRKNQ